MSQFDLNEMASALAEVRGDVRGLTVQVVGVQRDQVEHLRKIHALEIRVTELVERAVHEHAALRESINALCETSKVHHAVLTDHIKQEDKERAALLNRTTGILVTMAIGFLGWIGTQVFLLSSNVALHP